MMSLSLCVESVLILGTGLGTGIGLPQPPISRTLPVPARTLNGIVELATLATALAVAYAHGTVWAFNLPVVRTIRSLGSLLCHCPILSFNECSILRDSTEFHL